MTLWKTPVSVSSEDSSQDHGNSKHAGERGSLIPAPEAHTGLAHTAAI